MHIFATIKFIGPASLYVLGIIAFLMGVAGKGQTTLLLVAFLLPLRNIIEKIQAFPLGTQFIDILLLGVILGGIFHKMSVDSTRDKSGISTIGIIAVLYLLFSLLRSSLYLYHNISFDIHDSRVQDWKNFGLLPLLFFLVFHNNTDKKQVWTTFAVMCAAMFLADYYTARQIGLHSGLGSREQIKGTFEFLGPNEVAAFFNEYTIILMSVFYAIKGRNKWLLGILITANLYCITFLYSRGAYAGLMMGMLILFGFKDKKWWIPLLLVLALWQTVLPQNVVDRIKETKTATGQLDESSQRRIDIWHQGMDYFKANPIEGIGFGTFRNLGLDLNDTHNIYIKILTEQGLVGFIIFLIILACFLRQGWMLYQKGDDEMSRSMGLGFVCCLFVLMVNNFFGDRWSYLEPNSYLWIFAGLVTRLNAIAQNTKDVAPQVEIVTPVFTAKPQYNASKPRKTRYYDPSPLN